jgi:Fuc2NAc and GlcNAc transferase
LLIRHAGKLGLLQQPNERSSHQQIVPHGGGLGLVLAFSFAVALLSITGALDWRFAHCLLTAGCLLAALGLWDDIAPLPATYRLLLQGGAIIFTLSVSANIVALSALPLWLVYGVAAFSMLWWLNLFNFMDGIDGLAASEALFICAAAALLTAISNPDRVNGLTVTMLLLFAAIAGFLILNWPPARVFMGDVGSTFLGYALAVFALDSVTSGQLPLLVWLILGSVFWVDSTLTLLRRMARGERWSSAHRSHAYQRYAAALSRHYQSRGQSAILSRANAHRTTTMAVMTIDILWLLPLAGLVIIAPSWQGAWLTLAWVPLVWLALKSGAYG